MSEGLLNVLYPVAGYTYFVHTPEGEEVEHFLISRVHGRIVEMKVTSYSCLVWKSTRLKWRKMVEGLYQAGCTVVKKPTSDSDFLHPSSRKEK